MRLSTSVPFFPLFALVIAFCYWGANRTFLPLIPFQLVSIIYQHINWIPDHLILICRNLDFDESADIESWTLRREKIGITCKGRIDRLIDAHPYDRSSVSRQLSTTRSWTPRWYWSI